MLRYGIIGCGRIAAKFAGTFSAGLVNDAVIEAVAASDYDRAEAFAQAHGVKKFYGSHDALLADAEIDVVYIATTNNMHLQNCLSAIAAGKHIICEKPLAQNAADVERIIEAAESKGVFIMEAMWTRFLPVYTQAKDWIEQGKIGELQYASGQLCVYRHYSTGDRLYEPALGGGATLDLGVYTIEAVDFFAKPRKLIDIQSVIIPGKETGVDIASYQLMLYSGGFVADIQCGFKFEGQNHLVLYGTKGYLRLTPILNFAQKLELFLGDQPKNLSELPPKPDEEFTCESPSGFEYQINHVTQCIKNGMLQSNIMPMSDTLTCARIFDTILSGKKSGDAN